MKSNSLGIFRSKIQPRVNSRSLAGRWYQFTGPKSPSKRRWTIILLLSGSVIASKLSPISKTFLGILHPSALVWVKTILCLTQKQSGLIRQEPAFIINGIQKNPSNTTIRQQRNRTVGPCEFPIYSVHFTPANQTPAIVTIRDMISETLREFIYCTYTGYYDSFCFEIFE